MGQGSGKALFAGSVTMDKSLPLSVLSFLTSKMIDCDHLHLKMLKLVLWMWMWSTVRHLWALISVLPLGGRKSSWGPGTAG